MFNSFNFALFLWRLLLKNGICHAVFLRASSVVAAHTDSLAAADVVIFVGSLLALSARAYGLQPQAAARHIG